MALLLATRWKRAALAVVLTFAAVAALAGAFGGTLSDDFTIPGAESQRAFDLLDREFPAAAGDTATLVFFVDGGTVREPARAAAIASSIATVRRQPHVSGVQGPFGPRGRGQVSRDGRVAFATVQYDRPAIDLPDAGTKALTAARSAERAGVQVAGRGQIVDESQQEDAPVGELIGIALAVVLLTLLFRSLAAMAVTLLGAFVGIAFGLLMVQLVAAVLTLPTFATQIGLMLGLGAGIDYALLIVGRYREQRADGDDLAEAAGVANGTAGMSVLAAGVIVVVAISGLLTAGIPFVGGMGIGSGVIVAGVVISSLTILPVAMGALGDRLAPERAHHAERSDAFARWDGMLVRRPVPAALVGVALLVALALPALHMDLGMPDDATKSRDTTQRVAYDRLSEGFGPGFNGPLLLAVDLPADRAAGARALRRITAGVERADGVLAVGAATPNPGGTAAIVTVTPTTAPQDSRTSALIDRLRDDVLPRATAGTGAVVSVGGATATFKDLTDKVASRLPVFIAAVVLLSVLLLMAAFRSIWVPLVSAVFNLLGIAAAYGAVTLVFNDGFALGIVGLDETIPTISFVPLMMFAILFGLSMDYNVFLLSRIREAHMQGDAPADAVVHGMGRIAKMILVAGAVMAAVFAGFMFSPDPIVKQMGFGLSVAILIDVLIVRMLVAPAVVTLLGEHAWTLPPWLDRILPEIHLEGEDEVVPPAG